MISVIIPSYNRAKTILQSVNSVLSQTYSDIECLVVDDGSTDNTEDVINRINDVRLRYIKLENNMGACAARNKGIELSKGEFIAFQDSDDVWKREKLEVQLNALHFSGADVCFCNKLKHSIADDITEYTITDLSEGLIPYEILYRAPKVSTQTLFAHRYVFEKIKFDEKVQKAQDYEWTIRAGSKYKFYFVTQALVDQYMQTDSISARGEKDYRIELRSYQYFYNKFKDIYKLYPGLEIRLFLGVAHFKVLSGENAAEEYLKLYELSGNRKEYIKYLLEKLRPGTLKKLIQYKRKRLTKFL